MLPRLLLSAALALVPLPALADVTAHYAVGKDGLSIEADDGGDWRVEVPGQFSLIRRDKLDYIVLVQDKETTVFKLDDLIALAKPKLFGAHKPSDPFTTARFALTDGGASEVAGYKGVRWNFGPEKADPNGPSLAVVTSKDPALAPIGAVFRALEQRVEGLAAGQFGAESNFVATVRRLFESGTPLSAAPLIVLRSVNTAEIDPKRFELPGPVLDSALLDLPGATDATTSMVPEAPPLP
ncbi:hypothetical protein E5A73_13145 [Sphingomonas gei]|uniref:DUF4412 domain-containing protein n=1 Tax=Sphingomonas gei TaxID=1395960 RepID=A0A4S1XCH6_9SPHN|nr:hypothetical protein [Sphingomonas gei]TGX52596.1 hypothetical protein E5A73_13145 [Sphingomonas gei]